MLLQVSRVMVGFYDI